jgi:hypothetical protein
MIKPALTRSARHGGITQATRSERYAIVLGRDLGQPNNDCGASTRKGIDVRTADELREVLITLSPRQFESLALDLKLLREHGAESNTRAIVDAVHEQAARIRVGEVDDRSTT